MNGEEKPSLIEFFEKAKNIHKDLENTSLLTNSSEYQAMVTDTINEQKNVDDGIKLLEQCTEIINDLQVFSRNETLEDISNESLQYLTIPAYLGSFTLKSNSHSRVDILKNAKVYFKDFLQRLKSYEITEIQVANDDDDEEDLSKTSAPSLESMARERNEKIARFRKEKELDEKLESLEKMLASETIDVEDSTVRELYLTQINRWILTACEELSMISMEMNVLKNIPKDRQKVEKQPKVPLKPVIITRNELQKKVFGLGYPSIPTMTIDDFISKKVEEGSLAINSSVYENSLQQWAVNPELKRDEDDKEAETKEKKEEVEDEEAIRRAREWDDWKDENRRGWGNRQNMS